MARSEIFDQVERTAERLCPPHIQRWLANYRQHQPQDEVVAFRGCCEVMVRRSTGGGNYGLFFVTGDPRRPEYREVA